MLKIDKATIRLIKDNEIKSQLLTDKLEIETLLNSIIKNNSDFLEFPQISAFIGILENTLENLNHKSLSFENGEMPFLKNCYLWR